MDMLSNTAESKISKLCYEVVNSIANISHRKFTSGL